MDIWHYRKNFAYDTPLAPGDPLSVNLNEARGDYSRQRLMRELGIHVANNCLLDPPENKCVLFGGHRGCGKSTELRALARDLAGTERFFVIEVDALKALDINNLNFADVALALAEALAERAGKEGIQVPDVYIRPLRDWFAQVTRSMTLENSASAEVKAGAKMEAGLPFIGKLFASLTTAIRSNTTHKTEIRENVRNSFSTLANHFNTLLAGIAEGARQLGLGKTPLFVVDGTDRLRGDEADNFFIRDIHPLRQLKANIIYCAPINVLNEQGQVAQNYDAIFRLPMVKLAEKGRFGAQDRIPIAWDCLRQLVLQRMPGEYFDSPTTLDSLIECSGGHPRDLLRLINLCFQEIDVGPITSVVAKTAMRRLGNDYRRLVEQEDYPLLVEIDRAETSHTPANEKTRRLLYDLALLEYNSYWWQSHPAVRMLDAYITASTSARPG